MIAVIFEVEIADGRKTDYLDIAAELKPLLEQIDGFISVERFQSLTNEGKLLSLSFFRDEGAVAAWRDLAEHRMAQTKGRAGIFANYRLRVASVLRDYSMTDRAEVPADSLSKHG
ncbi:MAG: antibiotic biosynthesis monooxygenase [Cognatishimia sp.]|uniref:antibiotic biosynthesis monooxygenase family protein n=1 Tax=Cognatishimia sp. TaxID=2211648 RepID=UPI003B8C4F7A